MPLLKFCLTVLISKFSLTFFMPCIHAWIYMNTETIVAKNDIAIIV